MYGQNDINIIKMKKWTSVTTIIIIIIALIWMVFMSFTAVKLPAYASSACKIKAGERLSYSFSTESELIKSAKATSDDEMNEVNTQMIGNISFLGVSAFKNYTKIAAQLSGTNYSVNGMLDKEKAKALSQPFEFHLHKDCRISDFSFESEVLMADRQIIISLVEGLQVELPAETGVEDWKTIEEDSMGEYRAKYKVKDANDMSVILEKVKKDYIKISSRFAKKDMTAKIISSDLDITLRPEGKWLEYLSGEETLELYDKGNLITRSINSFDFIALYKPVRNIALWRHDKSQRDVTMSDFDLDLELDHPTPYKTNVSAKEVSGVTFNEVLSDFLSLTSSEDPTLRKKALDMLVQYLITNPAAATELINSLKRDEIPDNFQQRAVLAFGLAGTEESQKALISILSDPSFSKKNRKTSSIALKIIANPQPEVVDALVRQMHNITSPKFDDDEQEIAISATLALGELGYRNREDNPEYLERAKSELLKFLHDEREQSGTPLFLEALGKIKDPSLVPEIAPYLADESAKIRVMAASALIYMESESAESRIIEYLDEEESIVLRHQVIRMLSTKEGESSQNLLKKIVLRVSDESDDIVRTGMVHLLVENGIGDESVRQSLLQLLQTETNPRNIRLIRNYLNMNGDNP